MSVWYTAMLFNVTSLCGCFDARLYSAPMGEKSVAMDCEKVDPDCNSAARQRWHQCEPVVELTLHRVPEHSRVLEHLLARQLDGGEFALAAR